MIVIISKDDCVYCDKAKEVLKEKQYPYHELKLDVDISTALVKKVFPNRTTVPMIFDMTTIGGLPELIDYINGEPING